MSAGSVAVVDSWAILAFLRAEEPRAAAMRRYLRRVQSGNLRLLLNVVNLGEVFYRLLQITDEAQAIECLTQVRAFPIDVAPARESLVLKAARVKAAHPLSYADAFAVAIGRVEKAPVIRILRLAVDLRTAHLDELATQGGPPNPQPRMHGHDPVRAAARLGSLTHARGDHPALRSEPAGGPRGLGLQAARGRPRDFKIAPSPVPRAEPRLAPGCAPRRSRRGLLGRDRRGLARRSPRGAGAEGSIVGSGGGSIVLFHDTLYTTVEEDWKDRRPMRAAVEQLLVELKDYRFVTIPELFKLGRPFRWHWYQPARLDWLERVR